MGTKALSRQAMVAMPTQDLLARLKAIDHNLSIIRCKALGCRYYKRIPEVRAEWNQNQYERRQINAILLGRSEAILDANEERAERQAA